MAKNIKKLMAMTLVVCMLVSALPLQALAADGVEHSTETSSEGITTHVTTTTNGTGTPTVTVTIEKDTNGSYKDSEGNNVTVDRHEETKTETKTAENGATSEKVTESGSETKEWDEEIQVGEKVPEVNVTIQRDEAGNPITNEDGKIIISGSANGDPKTEGQIVNGNGTTTETTTNREVNGTLGLEQDFVMDPMHKDNDLSCPVKPSDYEGKQEIGTSNGRNDHENHYFPGLQDVSDEMFGFDKPTDEGYDRGFDMTWSGASDSTESVAAMVVETPYYLIKKDEQGNELYKENGDPIYETDRNGNPILDMEKTVFVTGKGGAKAVGGMVLTASQFSLKHENGEIFYAYCMDPSTGANPTTDRWYNIKNLDDAVASGEGSDGYMSEEDAAMIRAIVNAGYWGTDANVYEEAKNEDGTTKYQTNEDGTPKVDENGNPIPVLVAKKDENGKIVTDPTVVGSVAYLKAKLWEAYPDPEEKIVVRYPGDNTPHEYNVGDLIDGLTEAEAMSVTQAAIWYYANNGSIVYNEGSNGTKVTTGSIAGVLSALKEHNDNSNETKGWLSEYTPTFLEKDANSADSKFGGQEIDFDEIGKSDARMQALFMYFLGLTPAPTENTNETTILPNGDTFTDVALVVKDKVADGETTDENGNKVETDVYNTDLTFTLAFVPDSKSDDMLVYLYETNADGSLKKDEKGEPIVMKDKDGKELIRRLAGKDDKGNKLTDYEYLTPDEKGVYTLPGLQLGENMEHTFDLRLEGTQNLENGVYIYQAHGGRNDSQTLVGLAEGKQHMAASAKLNIKFEVDEANHVVANRVWYREYDPNEEPPQGPNDPPEDPWNPPEIRRLANDGIEIPEEPVPLAAPVITGDNTILWIAMFLLLACGMITLNLFDKKRKDVTF